MPSQRDTFLFSEGDGFFDRNRDARSPERLWSYKRTLPVPGYPSERLGQGSIISQPRRTYQRP